MTPAPNVAAVDWKPVQLRANRYDKHGGLTKQRIKQAIDEDVEFLKTHPTRGISKSAVEG